MNLIILTVFALVVSATADSDDYQRQLRDGSAQFTSKFFAEAIKENPDKSMVLSAFSVLPPLAQLSLAAVGESHDELLNAIGVKNDNVTRAAFPVATSQLKSIKGIELKLASKVYVASDTQLQEQFECDIKQIFDSEIQKVDFTKSQETANAINNWVEEKTNHRIKNLVDSDSLDESTRAILVNAIYFKGNWKDQFNKDYTADRDFYISSDKTKTVPTMYKHGTYKYSHNTEIDAQLLEIPYEEGEVSFLIVLPNSIEGLPDLLEQVKGNHYLLANAVRNMQQTELDVHLPKFKIETTTNLKEVLMKIGVTKIFDPQTARLDNLIKTGDRLYVSEAVQKAYIEINEEGAEAAASNAFEVMAESLPPQFEANRPFMFAIKVKDGPLLFSGVFRG